MAADRRDIELAEVCAAESAVRRAAGGDGMLLQHRAVRREDGDA
jgi:hypothetical protein